jgi:hypothetical protein
MSITPDILNDPCTSLDNFTINGSPGSTVSIDNGIKLFTPGNEEIGEYVYVLSDLSSSPNQITIEVITNFTKLGSYFEGGSYDYTGLVTTTRIYVILFTTNGLYILYEESFVRIPDVILYNETAADQIWRLEIDKTIETNATVEVFLNNVSLGSYNIGFASENDNNQFAFVVNANLYQIAEAHVKSIKIGTGLGEFASEISIVPKTKYMNVGDSQQLTVYNGTVDVTSSATFSSSNSGVASVTSGGLVRSISTGMSSITATVGEFTATALIVVQYALPQNSQIVSFASRHGVYRSMEYKSKRYKFKPASLSCIKVIADQYPVEIDVIFPSLKRAQSVSITSSRAQRIKSALVDCCEVVIRGNSQVSAVFLASSMDELPL